MEIKSKNLHLHATPVLFVLVAVLILGTGVVAHVIDANFLKDGLTTFNSAKNQDKIKPHNLGNDAVRYLEN